MALDRLLAPRSIAVVGASERPSIGRTIIDSLGVLGFEGAVHPVHPRYETVLGHPCHKSLEDVPGDVDLAALCLGYERLMPEVEKAAAKGVGALVIFSGGFAEAGEEGRAAQARLIAICRDHDIALCGPNCMGVMSVQNKSHAYMMDVFDPKALAGNVGLISQSGSISIGLLTDTRRFGFSHVISSGNEAMTTTAAYMEHLIDDPATEVIAIFAESINEPERFIAALDRASAAGKPVVVLKAGKSARAAAAIQTHTGGMAGESRVLSAVLRAHRAIEVNDLEEMTEVLAALQGRRWPKGDRIAIVTGSGGHAELLLDAATEADLNVPPLGQATRQAIESEIGSLTGDGNPADAWGQGDFAANFTVALREIAASGDYDAIVLSLDANDGQAVDYADQDEAINGVMRGARADHDLPLYLMSTRHGVHKTAQINAMRDEGIPSLGGMKQALGAIMRVARWAEASSAAHAAPDDGGGERPDWASRASVHEFDAKRLLAGAGLPTVNERLVDDLPAALEAASDIGYPVVLKVVGDAIPHRSEHGLIELRLSDADDVAAAWARLQERLVAMPVASLPVQFVVQAMAPSGVEVIAGIARDPAFGLVMAVGAGGVLAELFDDVAMCCLPPRQGDIEGMLTGGRLAHLLAGFRGSGPADTGALCDALNALAGFATAHADAIEGIDINPLLVYPEGKGCLVVDALIVPRSES
ncbi:MAG: acetate--CoA ligase family protein [Pseudomonadota bacterium]